MPAGDKVDPATEVTEELEMGDIEHEPLTLKRSLEMFGFNGLLKKLDDDLENVRRHIIKPAAHEQYFNSKDKQMLLVSRKYHPDRIKMRGDSGNDVKSAKDLQAALNATRTLLKSLKVEFLGNLDIDYNYQFYGDVDISCFGTEKEIAKLNLAFQYEIIMFSEIKHKRIITNINEFLAASKRGLVDFLDSGGNEFHEHLSVALRSLCKCVEGYEELIREINVTEEAFKNRELKSAYEVIQRNAAEYKSQLVMLEALRKRSKSCLKDQFQIYTTNEVMDPYFVLPFVKYVNVLLMCYIMHDNDKPLYVRCRHAVVEKCKKVDRNEHNFKQFGTKFEEAYSNVLKYIDETSLFSEAKDQILKSLTEILRYPEDTASGTEVHCNESIQGNEIKKEEMHSSSKDRNARKKEIKEGFFKIIKYIQKELDEEFKIDSYTAVGNAMYIAEGCAKIENRCDRLYKNIQRMNSTLENMNAKSEEMIERYHKNSQGNDKLKKQLDETLKEKAKRAEKLNSEVAQCIEESKKFLEEMRNSKQVMNPPESEEAEIRRSGEKLNGTNTSDMEKNVLHDFKKMIALELAQAKVPCHSEICDPIVRDIKGETFLEEIRENQKGINKSGLQDYNEEKTNENVPCTQKSHSRKVVVTSKWQNEVSESRRSISDAKIWNLEEGDVTNFQERASKSKLEEKNESVKERGSTRDVSVKEMQDNIRKIFEVSENMTICSTNDELGTEV